MDWDGKYRLVAIDLKEDILKKEIPVTYREEYKSIPPAPPMPNDLHKKTKDAVCDLIDSYKTELEELRLEKSLHKTHLAALFDQAGDEMYGPGWHKTLEARTFKGRMGL